MRSWGSCLWSMRSGGGHPGASVAQNRFLQRPTPGSSGLAGGLHSCALTSQLAEQVLRREGGPRSLQTPAGWPRCSSSVCACQVGMAFNAICACLS